MSDSNLVVGRFGEGTRVPADLLILKQGTLHIVDGKLRLINFIPDFRTLDSTRNGMYFKPKDVMKWPIWFEILGKILGPESSVYMMNSFELVADWLPSTTTY